MRRLLGEKIVFKLFFMLFVSICIPIIGFSVISYYMSYKSIYNSYIESKNDLNKQIAENVKDNFYALKSQSLALYNYDSIAYIVNTSKENLTEKYVENYNIVYGNLVSIIQGNFKLDSISIIDLNGEVKFYYDRSMASQNLNTVSEESWFREAIDANGRAIIVPPHYNRYTNARDPVVSVCRVIMNPYDDKIVGVLKIDQKTKTLEQIFSNIERESGEIDMVYNQKGDLFYSNADMQNAEWNRVYSNLDQLIQKPAVIDGERRIVTYGSSSDEVWKMVSLFPVKNVAGRADFIKNINTMLAIILFFVCAGLSVLVSITINIPICKLIQSIKRFQQGNMYEQVQINRRDEFGSIADAINEMITSIRKLVKEEYEMKLLKKQAEFENYQSQINPHFLFNTLNSIKAVAMQGENGKTAEMIQYLSDHFRYSLNRGVYLVPFAEELEYINKYMYLQSIRFQDRYQFIKEIDEDVWDDEIPRMVLQPIVENAIKHGLENSAQVGIVQIVAQNIGDDLYIYISNTGKIIADDEMAAVNAQLDLEESQYAFQNKDKVGIYNVNARIRYHYGELYGLKFMSNAGNQTTMRIRLPRIKVKDEGLQDENFNH